MDRIVQALRLLRPGELFPLWSLVDRLEQVGDISPGEAARWKDGIFELMVRRGHEPEEVIEATARRLRKELELARHHGQAMETRGVPSLALP